MAAHTESPADETIDAPPVSSRGRSGTWDDNGVRAGLWVSRVWAREYAGPTGEAHGASGMKQAERDAWTEYAEQRASWRDTTARDPPKPRKYGNVQVQVDGYTFDSKKEAARWQELKYMQQAGQIAELERQPVFPLWVVKLYRNGIPPIALADCGSYVADFRYLDLATGEWKVEDVKSIATRTALYRLKRKIAEAVHGIVICEV